MPTAASAKVDIESGQTSAGNLQLTDSGDQTLFTSADTYWSNDGAQAPVVRPNGVLTGGIITPAAAGGDNNVDIAAMTICEGGVEYSISATTDETIARPTVSNFVISSVTINNAQAVAIVQGTEGSSFSETRGAAGGPPLIPVDSVEVGQVRYSSQTAAAVLTTEIFQVHGTHMERCTFPGWTVLYGRSEGNAGLQFDSALPEIHTGTVPKQVFVDYYTPIFAEVQSASDYVPAENSFSVSSTQLYNKTVGATSSSLTQGSFNALVTNGVNDLIITRADKVSWVRFYPDRTKAQHIMTLGTIGVTRSFPAGDNISVACTVSAEEKSINRES